MVEGRQQAGLPTRQQALRARWCCKVGYSPRTATGQKYAREVWQAEPSQSGNVCVAKCRAAGGWVVAGKKWGGGGGGG